MSKPPADTREAPKTPQRGGKVAKRAIPVPMCKERVYSDRYDSPCSRRAVRDGYCAIHHPDAVAARRKASDERYQASRRASDRAASALAYRAKIVKLAQKYVEALDRYTDTLNQTERLPDDTERHDRLLRDEALTTLETHTRAYSALLLES